MGNHDASAMVATRWKKGQSGNPNGSREYHNRRRSAKEVSTECLARIAETLFDGSLDDLKALADDPSVTPIERLCIGVVVKAYEKGDAFALGLLLDRFIGKVPDKKAITVDTNKDDEGLTIQSLSDEELERRRAIINEVIE